MFNDHEWGQLVDELAKLTRAGALDWSTDVLGELVTTVGETRYSIGSIDGDGRLPYYLHVTHGERIVAALESEPIDEDHAQDDVWVSFTPGQRLPSLRDLALRSAEGAPQLFGKLIKDLEAMDPDATPF